MKPVENLRTYGGAPYSVAVVHGGPGAGGEMAPVARELSSLSGVLEPIQTARTLEGQIEELQTVLEKHGHVPVALIGYSWGAWLSFIVTARYPALVRKLILVASGPFEESYVPFLHEARMSRLNNGERIEFEAIIKALRNPATKEEGVLLARLGALASKTDTYEAIPDQGNDPEAINLRGDIFQGVWESAARLRRSGELLGFGNQIHCPVIAIHGDYDPHSAKGVERPLSAVMVEFRFVLLEKCGHKPWIERYARDDFYRIVKEELS